MAREEESHGTSSVETLRVLFVDIDGVLNYTGFHEKFKDESHDPFRLSVEHLRRLARIVRISGCRICMSTSWRMIPTWIQKFWLQFIALYNKEAATWDGIGSDRITEDSITLSMLDKSPMNEGSFIAVTKERDLRHTPDLSGRSLTRAHEIMAVVKQVTELMDKGTELRWCALDDLDLTGKLSMFAVDYCGVGTEEFKQTHELISEFSKHFVQTSPEKGLTDGHVEVVTAMLGCHGRRTLTIIEE